MGIGGTYQKGVKGAPVYMRCQKGIGIHQKVSNGHWNISESCQMGIGIHQKVSEGYWTISLGVKGVLEYIRRVSKGCRCKSES